MDRPWAIYSDLSGVANIERAEIADKMARAKRHRRKLRRS